MSAGLDDEALKSTALPRPRDRKWKSTGTWKGKGGQGEGEEEDPWRRLQLEAANFDAGNVFDDQLELEDASLDLGVDRGEEALELPAPRRRHLPCEQA